MSRLTTAKKRAIAEGLSNTAAICEEQSRFRSPLYTACMTDYEDCYTEDETTATDLVATIDSNIEAVLMGIAETATQRMLCGLDLSDFYDLAVILDRHANDIRRIISCCDNSSADSFSDEPGSTEAFRDYYYCH